MALKKLYTLQTGVQIEYWRIKLPMIFNEDHAIITLYGFQNKDIVTEGYKAPFEMQVKIMYEDAGIKTSPFTLRPIDCAKAFYSQIKKQITLPVTRKVTKKVTEQVERKLPPLVYQTGEGIAPLTLDHVDYQEDSTFLTEQEILKFFGSEGGYQRFRESQPFDTVLIPTEVDKEVDEEYPFFEDAIDN